MTQVMVMSSTSFSMDGFGNDQVKGPILSWYGADNTITYTNCTFYNVCSSGAVG